MNYPKEWLGFRVTRGGRFTRKGGIVEAIAVQVDPYGNPLPRRVFGVRCLTGMRSDYDPGTHWRDGYRGHGVYLEHVEPLTPGARAFMRSVPR